MDKVLIVSVDLLLMEALDILIMEEKRYQVVQKVQTGEHAVQICQEHAVDIIFMDMQLPGMIGIAASRMIKQSFPKMTIYLLAAYPVNTLMKNLIEESVNKIIEKPVTQSALKKLLDHDKIRYEDFVHQQFDQLLFILKQKNFQLLYSSIAGITEEIYEVMEQNPVRIYKMLMMIGQALFNTTDFDEVENRSIEHHFPLNGGLIIDKKTTEIWLFKIMNYLFQKNSINRFPLLDNIFLYIEKNIKQDITLNKIIAHCTISQGYLSRIFREQFKVSVMEYLHLRKIYLAKAYFYFSNDNTAEVAFRLGYNESSYFRKVFKKYEHVTVKQYKRSLSSNIY